MNMTMVSKYKKRLLSGTGLYRFLITGLFVLSSLSGFAQFTISENFKGSGYPDIKVGDGAYFTSGVDDRVNEGWLRLTRNSNNQKGYAYINKAFPSTLGVLIDFEYLMWKDTDGGQGADGIGVFLFDAKYGPDAGANQFKLGAYGGSLGYAPIIADGQTYGLTGGYIGIGLDAYGNFARKGEGQITTGTDIEKPNAIVLRGPSTNNFAGVIVNGIQPSNRFLKGVTLKDNNIFDIFSETGIKSQDEVDYNTKSTTRPSENTFYRRVQVEIAPIPGNLYKITVRWKKSTSAFFTELISYNTEDVPPALLKIGFAASTGGDKNYHEIRNLRVTTPGNLRVSKRADKNSLRTISGTNPTNQNDVTYTIDVVNDTNAPLTGVDFTDKITDGNGNLVTSGVNGMFTITSVTHSGFAAGTVLPAVPATNQFTGKLNMNANSTGMIIVKGTLKAVPAGNMLINTTSSYANDIVDQDLDNNIDAVSTPVLSEDVDLVINSTVDQACVDANAGNYHKLVVANIGGIAATYGGETIVRPNGNFGLSGTYNRNRIEVSVVVPSTYNLANSSHAGWQLTTTANSPSAGFNTYTYLSNFTRVTPTGTNTAPPVANLNLNPGMVMQSITFNIKNGAGDNINYALNPKVRWIVESGSATKPNALPSTIWTYEPYSSRTSLEVPENEGNNTTNISMIVRPAAPVTTTTVYYCQNEAGKPLVATATGTNTLVWYLAPDGVPFNTAFTPNTNIPGTTSYYVSQSNGSCESPMVKIDVIVMQTPTAGWISTDTPLVCRGTALTRLIEQLGTGANGSVITYKWEKSEDAGASWTVVQGQTDRAYHPMNIKVITSYRRTTIATLGGKSCESVPTAPMIVRVRNCTLISNPMLPSKARSN